MPACPECGVGIQPTWDWCHGCGFDPEGLKPAGWQPSAAAAPGTHPPAPGATPTFASPGAVTPGAPSGPGGAGRPAHPEVGFPPAPGYGVAYPPPGFVAPSFGPSTSRVLVIVGAVVAVLVLLPITAIAAVTLLGRSSTSRFEPVATTINQPVSTTLPAEWTSWSPPDGSLTIQVPNADGMEPMAAGSPPPAGVLSAPGFETPVSSSGIFLLLWLDLDPAYAFDNDKGLKGMANGAATQNGGTLLTSERGTFAGMDSITFTFEKHGVQGRGFGFVAGKRVYTLASFGPDYSSEAVFQKYVDSLHLK